MKKSVCIYELEPWEKQHIQRSLSKARVVYVDSALSSKNVQKAKHSEALACFIHSAVTREVLTHLPNLRYVTTMSTGFDHIDLTACKERGILVSNVPYYGENTVAEHAFGLLLSLSRKLPQAIESTRAGSFNVTGLMGFDLKGKTLGVIGAGHIGQHVIRMAKAFDMKVIAFNKTKDMKLAKSLGFSYCSLTELLRTSDVITLHVPLLPSTEHIINMKTVKQMKRGVYLINTARGELVDTDALLYGLRKGIIAGAGLDVIEGEHELLDHRRKDSHGLKEHARKKLQLLQKYQVLVTPHCAFCTKEAIQRILDTTSDNLHAFFKGKPQNLVSS